MSTQTPNRAGPVASPSGRWHGRGGLIVPLILGTVCTLVVIGMAQMEIPGDADFPGPKFFPTILVVIGYVLTALMVIDVLRHPDPKANQTEYSTYSDWRPFAWVAGGFMVFAVLLPILGWVLGAGLLFWCVAHGFGSKRPLFDISVGLLISSGIYLLFGQLLGLPLPSGLLGGI